MEEFAACWEELDDPRTGNAALHDFNEMLVIALCSVLSGGQGAWATGHIIWQFFATWRSTQCRGMQRKAPCAESSSEPAGTMLISPAFWPYFEVRLPCLPPAR